MGFEASLALDIGRYRTTPGCLVRQIQRHVTMLLTWSHHVFIFWYCSAYDFMVRGKHIHSSLHHGGDVV